MQANREGSSYLPRRARRTRGQPPPPPLPTQDEWFKLRGQLLTGSDVATALGENPYRTRRSLLLSKLGLKEHDTGNSAFTVWGNEKEDECLSIYSAETGKKYQSLGLVVHPQHRWLGASPDGVTNDGRLLEVKCPVKRRIEPGVVPPYYYPQLQVLMEVLDLPEADFIQYMPATDFCSRILDVTRVKRDRAWWEDAFPRMKAFYDEWRDTERRMEQEPDFKARIVAEWAVKNERKTCKRPRRAPVPRFVFADDPDSAYPA